MDFENGRPEATDVGAWRPAMILENLPFREDLHTPPLHPYRGIRLLLGLIAASLLLPLFSAIGVALVTPRTRMLALRR